MQFMNIASGSTGNATYVGTETTHLLIDAGISRKRIIEGLAKLNVTLEDLDAILITHEHIDHVKSLAVLEKKNDIPIYATSGTIEGINNKKSVCVDKDVFVSIEAGKRFQIGDINITPLNTYHDALEPVCFRFDTSTSSCAIVTDLGDFDDYLVSNLQSLSALMIEANHDKNMLEVGSYPYSTKLRIAGRFGHLSNEQCGCFLNSVLHDHVKHILLGHVSRENNNEFLAMLSVKNEIDFADNHFNSADLDIRLASYVNGSDIYNF